MTKLTKKMASAVFCSNNFVKDGLLAWCGDVYFQHVPNKKIHRDAFLLPTGWATALDLAPVAASRDDTRLNQIYFDGASVLATDGHRYHSHPFKLPDSIKPFGVSVCNPAALRDRQSAAIATYFWMDKVYVYFRIGVWELRARIQNEKFPAAASMLNRRKPATMRIEGLDYIGYEQMLRTWPIRVVTVTAKHGDRCLLMHGDDGPEAPWRVQGTGYAERVWVKEEETPWGEERVARFSVDAGYLADALEHVPDASLEMSDELGAILIRQYSAKWKERPWAIVMPCR